MIERNEYELPADAIEALARLLYPAVLAYYESEQGQREYAEWKEQRGKAIMRSHAADETKSAR